jgi:hypothetical protein
VAIQCGHSFSSLRANRRGGNVLTIIKARSKLPYEARWATAVGDEGISGTGGFELSAETVREQCMTNRVGGQELLFEKTRITGPLRLTDMLIDCLLRFTNCEFSSPIFLTGTRASAGVHLVDCSIQSLEADRLSVQGDLVLERVRGGPISLSGARLTGHLRCTGSQFLTPTGTAFNGQGMAVAGSALFDGGFRSAGKFILASARIDGSVDMTGASLTNKRGDSLTADGIWVGTTLLLCGDFHKPFSAEGTVRLAEAHVSGKLKCSGANFCASPARGTAIDAQLIDAAEICLDQGFKATGEVCLDGSTVKGRVGCDGGTFCNPGGIALKANGLDCRDMRLGYGFSAAGEVQLVGTRISRELNCTNGKFVNEEEKGVALRADGLICDGKVYLNKDAARGAFVACGRVRFRNARIKTELNCTGGSFSTLRMAGMSCDGSVYLNGGFKATGMVELVNVNVGRYLNCRGGEFGSFDAQRLTVGGKFDWRPGQTPGKVDISFADVGLLIDNPESSWPRTESQDATDKDCWNTKLAGFTFRDLDEEEARGHGEDITQSRIDWLAKAGYAPGIYRQLAHIYRQKGLDRDARNIAIAGQRARRSRGGLHFMPKAWDYFLDWSVGYGYRLHRPLLGVLFAGLIGIFFFHLAQSNNVMEAVSQAQGANIDANKCTSHYPCFFPITYAFEIFLPVINLRQVNYWLPNGASAWGQALFAWVWLAIIYGWIVTVALAAGIGNLIKQQD